MQMLVRHGDPLVSGEAISQKNHSCQLKEIYHRLNGWGQLSRFGGGLFLAVTLI